VSEGSGSKVKLKGWQQRAGRSLGVESAGGRPAPLIDQVHRLMHLWKTGDVMKVNEYLDARALRQNKMFHPLLQALIELAPQGSEERSLLEKISNHVVARGVNPQEELRL
jgi:putative DNA methylase